MKYRLLIICSLFVYSSIFGATNIIEKDGIKYLAGTVLVKFRNSAHAAGLSKSLLPKAVSQQLTSVGAGELQKVFETRLPGGEELEKIVRINYTSPVDPYYLAGKLAGSDIIEWAEPDFVCELAFTPNDPSFTDGNQYNLDIINAKQAWDITTGSDDVVIAIVDTGVDWEHEDLASKIWINEAEWNGTPGIDDDNNGYVDDIRGWDFRGLNGTPDNNPKEDRADHGTHVAGIASAATNNGIGVAAIGYNCKIMAVKISQDEPRDSHGNPALIQPYEGIVYAVDNGADVINCSWGGGGFSNANQETINYAVDNGVVVVASAGNEGSDELIYPARYFGVLSVGYSNSSDKVDPSSNYGKDIDVMAPGSFILSTWQSSSKYTHLTGSSMSSPLAAGLAGLVKTKFPDYTPLQIAEQIRANTDNIDNLNPSYKYMMGSGRINAWKAVGNTSGRSVRVDSVQYIDEGDKDGIPESGETFSIIADFTNYLSATTNLSIRVTTDNNFIELTSSIFNAGSKGTLISFNNISNRFSFIISEDSPLNNEIDFKIEFTDPGYNDFQWIESIVVNPIYKTQSANDIAVTVTSKGTIGFNDYPVNLQGDGFIYNSSGNMLFEGGLIYGTSSSKLVSAVRSGNQDLQSDEFSMITPFLISNPGTIADEEGISIFNDNNGGSKKLNIETELTTFSFADDEYSNFVIFRYTFHNKSGSDISNFYAGLFFDWDLYDAVNYAGYSDGNNFGYVYHEDTNTYEPYAGVALVSGGSDGYYAIQNNGEDGGINVYDGFADQEKWQAISTGVSKKTAGPDDISIVSSAGPFSIPANQKIQVAFSLASAGSLDSLVESVTQSRIKYNEIITDVDTDDLIAPIKFSLGQNYPNPFNPATTIEYSIPVDSRQNSEYSRKNQDKKSPLLGGDERGGFTSVSLKIYDILGREVATLVNEQQRPGEYQVRFDASSLTSGVYFYSLKTGSYFSTKKMVLLR